jgi:hypothetical protein
VLDDLSDDLSDGPDLSAVYDDDRLLDALAARLPVDPAHSTDPVVRLLAALAADVDADEIPVTPLTVDIGADSGADVIPVAPLVAARRPALSDGQNRPRRRRGHALAPRAVLAAGTAGAVLFAGGVAAAVTGNPLAPLTPIHDVITTVVEQVTPAGVKRRAADRALDDANEALSRGDRDAAVDLINEAQGQLDSLEKPPSDLQAEVRQLQERLAQQAQPGMAQAPLVGQPPVATPSEPAQTSAASTQPQTPDPTVTAAASEPTDTVGPSPDPSAEPTVDSNQTPTDTATSPSSPSPSTTPDESSTPSPSGTAPSPEGSQAASDGASAGGGAAPARAAAPDPAGDTGRAGPARQRGTAKAAPDRPAGSGGGAATEGAGDPPASRSGSGSSQGDTGTEPDGLLPHVVTAATDLLPTLLPPTD